MVIPQIQKQLQRTVATLVLNMFFLSFIQPKVSNVTALKHVLTSKNATNIANKLAIVVQYFHSYIIISSSIILILVLVFNVPF